MSDVQTKLDEIIKSIVVARDFDYLVEFMNEFFDIDAILSKNDEGVIVVDRKTGRDVVFIQY